MTYLGDEGYCIDVELRQGKQHCQKKGMAQRLGRVLGIVS